MLNKNTLLRMFFLICCCDVLYANLTVDAILNTKNDKSTDREIIISWKIITDKKTIFKSEQYTINSLKTNTFFTHNFSTAMRMHKGKKTKIVFHYAEISDGTNNKVLDLKNKFALLVFGYGRQITKIPEVVNIITYTFLFSEEHDITVDLSDRKSFDGAIIINFYKLDQSDRSSKSMKNYNKSMKEWNLQNNFKYSDSDNSLVISRYLYTD